MHRAAGSDFGSHRLGFTRWYRPKCWTRRAGSSGRSCWRGAPPRRHLNDCNWLVETRRKWPDSRAWLLSGQTVNDKDSWIIPSIASILSWFFGSHRWRSSQIFPTDEWQLRVNSALWNTEDLWSNWKPGHDVPAWSYHWVYFNWTDERQYAHPGDAWRWMTINLWPWRHTRNICTGCLAVPSTIPTTIQVTRSSAVQQRLQCWLQCRLQCRLQNQIHCHICFEVTIPRIHLNKILTQSRGSRAAQLRWQLTNAIDFRIKPFQPIFPTKRSGIGSRWSNDC